MSFEVKKSSILVLSDSHFSLYKGKIPTSNSACYNLWDNGCEILSTVGVKIKKKKFKKLKKKMKS